MRELIFLEPVFVARPWGGRRLHDFGYNLTIPDAGECLGISANSNGDCKVLNGTYEGMTLSRLYAEHRELFGDVKSDTFPLLVKILCAEQDTSIHVHPSVRENGRAECLYVLACKEDATMILGHRATCFEEAENMIAKGMWKDFLREIPIRKGDIIWVNPGDVHAVKAGTIVLETAHNSDLNYRIYDYHRMYNGSLRELNAKEALSCMSFPYYQTNLNGYTCKVDYSSVRHLTEGKDFCVDYIDIKGNTHFHSGKAFSNFSVISGSGVVDGHRVHRGQHFIVPFEYGDFRIDGQMELIRSTVI